MEQRKVSVIVPVYNAEKYLHRCVASIMDQTYRNLEIILVDDGATDGSGRLCDDLAKTDDRVRVVHQANGGVSSARNKGLALASGEYIMFVDSDDAVKPDYVMDMMTGEDADYVASGCLVQGSDLQWRNWATEELHTTLAQVKNDPRLIQKIPYGIVVGIRYRRTILQENGLQFSRVITRGEDTLFNSVYLAFCHSIRVVGKSNYEYYHIPGSATGRFNPNLFRWQLESLEKIGDIIGKDNDVFRERVWRKVLQTSENYFQTTHNAPLATKLKAIGCVFQICGHPYTRQSIPYAKKAGDKRMAYLVQFYLYPVFPLIYKAYSGVRRLFGRGAR